ncbi:MAG TPA: YfhO family protein [Chloroflexia bacterium]|nr:YfhO family protein [Chloroflexia bacterium]
MKIPRREVAWAVLGSALLATLFLGAAISTGRIISPADMLYNYYPWRAEQPAAWRGPSNDLLVDSAVQFEPWLEYSARRLHAGELPLWNADNMLGAPLIGNNQSAIFFPLNWPYLLWPDGWMHTLRLWLKLFIAGLGMYLAAREVAKAGPVGASVATLAFTYGAAMTVWLLYPLTATAMWLPWLWWATSRLISQPSASRLSLLAGIVALMLLAGHLQTAYHVMLATGLYALFHAWQTAPRQVGRLARTLGLWLAACGLGAMIASIQLLPFIEYSGESMALLRRTERQASGGLSLPIEYAWTTFSPDLWGNPARHTWWGTEINYNEAHNYIGMMTLILVPFALFVVDRLKRRMAFLLAALAVLALGVAYHAPVLYDVALALPGMSLLLNTRMVLVAQFALSMLAALGVEAFLGWLPEQCRRFAVGVALCVGVLLVVGAGVPALWAHDFFGVPPNVPQPNMVWQEALWRAATVIAVCGVVVGAVAALWAIRPRIARPALILVPVLVPVVLLADLWLAHAGYNPSVAREDYYPQTAATRFLQEQQRQEDGPFRVIAGGAGPVGVFMPNINLIYGLSDLRGYDALDPRLYVELAVRTAPGGMRATPGGFNTSRVLDLLNVRYVMAAPGDDPNYVVDVRQEASSGVTVGEIEGKTQPGQTFISQADNLAGIQVLAAKYGREALSPLIFHLKDGLTDTADLAAVRLDPSEFADNSWLNITFPPIKQASKRQFYFYIDSPEATLETAATLWYSKDDAYQEGQRVDGGTPVEGDLTFRTLSLADVERPWFVKVHDGGKDAASVYENRQALPRAWLVHRIQVEPDAATRISRLRDPLFDRAGTAILSEALPPGYEGLEVQGQGSEGRDQSEDAVTITTYKAEEVRISTRSDQAGLLVLSDLAFPGWEASLDGQPTQIITADHALRAVYVPAGEHAIRFVYAPPSFRIGAVLAGVGLVAMLVLLAWDRLRQMRMPAGPTSLPS